MISVDSGGAAERIAARILFKVLRAGSGTPARYLWTLFGAPLPFAAERRLPDCAFFMRAILRELPNQVYAPARRATVRPRTYRSGPFRWRSSLFNLFHLSKLAERFLVKEACRSAKPPLLY